MSSPARSAAARGEVGPTLWRRANRIVLDALRMGSEERPGYVAAACGQDEDLRREVESLLAVDPDLLARFERPALEWIDADSTPAADDHRIGPFEVIAELGRGGLAVVYLAVRTGGEDRRRVALKVIKPGADPQTLGRRLESEGRILKRLRHPYIADLYGGGVAADGRPYLVMEYIEGEPIDRFCTARRLDLRSRLELFLKVCSAVQHAHQNLIVHRDLKPSNILVTPAGEPRLLDFGIAKLLEPGSSAPSTWTAAGLRAMTPEYASPEQILAQPVTTASDVYSLGVVLYELLTGQRPFGTADGEGERLRHVLGQSEPPRPSELVERPAPATEPAEPAEEGSAEEMPSGSTRQEGDHRRRLARRLRGDLDGIALMALRAEPGPRYPTAARLALDVERHLAGLPVSARRSTVGYRLSKLLRRRPREIAAAVLSLALAAAFVVHLELQRSRLVEERDKTRQVSDFLVGLFLESDPGAARGRPVTVREVLDRGVSKVGELDGKAEIKASFMSVLGRVYRNLGLLAEAEPLLEESLVLRRRFGRGARAEVAESLRELGALRRLESELEGAERLLRESLELSERLHGRRHPMVAALLDDLGVVLRSAGRLEEAESYHRQALELKRELLGGDDPEVATTLGNLAVVLTDRGEYAAAEPLFEAALSIRRRGFEGDHPDVANSLNNLASLWWRRGEYEAAEPLYRQALAMRQRLFGERHPEVETSLNNLASLLHESRRYDEAEPLYRQSLDIARSLYGDDHPHVAVSLANLATLLMDRGELAEAESMLREVVASFRRAAAPELPLALNNLGRLLYRRGDFEAGESALREAYSGAVNDLGPRHPRTGFIAGSLARLLLARGSLEEAARLAELSADIVRQGLAGDHWRVAYAEAVQGSALSRMGRCGAAEPLLEAAHARLEEARGSRSERTLEVDELLRAHREACG